MRRRRSSGRSRFRRRMRGGKRRSLRPIKLPTMFGTPQRAIIKHPFTATLRMGDGIVTNANLTVSLRTLYDPLLGLGSTQPNGYNFWSGVYSSYRVRGVKVRLSYEIRDVDAITTTLSAPTGFAGWTLFNQYTQQGSYTTAPTTYHALDTVKFSKQQDVSLKWNKWIRNSSGMAGRMVLNSKANKTGNNPNWSFYVPLSGRDRSTPYSYPSIGGVFSSADIAYPQGQIGSSGGSIQPFINSWDKLLTLWSFAEAFNGATLINNLPYTYWYLDCMYYVEWFDVNSDVAT